MFKGKLVFLSILCMNSVYADVRALVATPFQSYNPKPKEFGFKRKLASVPAATLGVFSGLLAATGPREVHSRVVDLKSKISYAKLNDRWPAVGKELRAIQGVSLMTLGFAGASYGLFKYAYQPFKPANRDPQRNFIGPRWY